MGFIRYIAQMGPGIYGRVVWNYLHLESVMRELGDIVWIEKYRDT